MTDRLVRDARRGSSGESHSEAVVERQMEGGLRLECMGYYDAAAKHVQPGRASVECRTPQSGRNLRGPDVRENQKSNVAPTLATRAPNTDVGVSQAELVGLYVWL